jgi:hypothetical protein
LYQAAPVPEHTGSRHVLEWRAPERRGAAPRNCLDEKKNIARQWPNIRLDSQFRHQKLCFQGRYIARERQSATTVLMLLNVGEAAWTTIAGKRFAGWRLHGLLHNSAPAKTGGQFPTAARHHPDGQSAVEHGGVVTPQTDSGATSARAWLRAGLADCATAGATLEGLPSNHGNPT